MLKSDMVSTQKAIDNTTRANQIISTADSALGQISSLLNDIRGLVTAAANKGALSNDQVAANQLQVDSSLDSIDRIAQTTSFQGRKLLDGSQGFTYTSGAGMATVSDLQIQQANLGTTNSMTVATTITSAATQGAITDTIGVGAAVATATVATGGGNLVISTVATGSAQNGIAVNFVNTTSVASGAAVANYNSGAKTLTVYVNNATVATTGGTLNTAIAASGGGGVFTTDSGGSIAIGGAMPVAVSTLNGADGGLNAAVNFTLTGAKGSQVYSFGSTTTGTVIAAAINSNSDATGVTAAYGGTTLTMTASDYGSDKTIDVKVNSEGVGGTFGSGLSAKHIAGADIAAKVNGFVASGKGNTITLNNSTLNMIATVTGGSTTAFTYTITGGGALFQIGPDVVTNQQVRMGIDAMNTGSLGGADGQMFQLRNGNTASLATAPTTAATITNEAINKVTTLRGRLGAFQKTALKTNLNALGDTLTALTDAQSSIADADFAAETANLTRGQILVQSGTAVLQIANKQPENVLALLR
jgi:flagellin